MSENKKEAEKKVPNKQSSLMPQNYPMVLWYCFVSVSILTMKPFEFVYRSLQIATAMDFYLCCPLNENSISKHEQ